MTLIVPKSTADPGGPGRVVRAAQPVMFGAPETGAEIARLGEIAAGIGESIEQDRRQREMDRARIDMAADLNDLRLQVQQIDDPDAADAAWVGGASRLYESYLAPGEAGQPRVGARNAEAFQLAFDDLANRHAYSLGMRSLTGRQAARDKLLADHMAVALQTAEIADPDTALGVLADVHDHIDALAASGAMASGEAEAQKSAATAAVTTAQAAATGRRLDEIAAGAFAAEAPVDMAFLAREDVREHPRFARTAARLGLAAERPDLPRWRPADLAWLADHDAPAGAPPEVQAQRREAMLEMAAATQAALEADPIGHARAVGLPVAEVPPLDPANPAPFAAALARRSVDAEWLAEEGYVAGAAPLLSVDEQAALGRAFEDGAAREATGRAVAARFGMEAPAVLDELGLDAFAFDPDPARAVDNRMAQDANARILARAMDYAPSSTAAAEEIRTYLRGLDALAPEDRAEAVSRRVTTIRQTRRAEAPRPLFYGGGEITVDGLKAAAQRIVTAHRDGRMDAETYARQAALVRQLMEGLDG